MNFCQNHHGWRERIGLASLTYKPEVDCRKKKKQRLDGGIDQHHHQQKRMMMMRVPLMIWMLLYDDVHRLYVCRVDIVSIIGSSTKVGARTISV